MLSASFLLLDLRLSSLDGFFFFPDEVVLISDKSRLHTLDAFAHKSPSVFQLLQPYFQRAPFLLLPRSLLLSLKYLKLAYLVLLVQVHDQLVLSLYHSCIFLNHLSSLLGFELAISSHVVFEILQ